QPKDGLLALDRDGDGKITSGRELFSEFFDPDRATTGLGALALFDANHDGVIDAKDPVFGQLQVWQDANHDARTDTGELRTLDALGITSIQLEGRPANEPVDGGRIMTRTTFIQNWTAKDAAEVFFAMEGGNVQSEGAAAYRPTALKCNICSANPASPSAMPTWYVLPRISASRPVWWAASGRASPSSSFLPSRGARTDGTSSLPRPMPKKCWFRTLANRA